MRQQLNKRYKSTTKRTSFSRHLKELTFRKFRNEESHEERFGIFWAEIDRLSCLANDSDQTADGLWDFL